MIACKVKLKSPARTIEALSGDGFFRFVFKTGRRQQTIKLTDDAAWIVARMINSMHPRVTHSNDSDWLKVQELRKQHATVKESLSVQKEGE